MIDSAKWLFRTYSFVHGESIVGNNDVQQFLNYASENGYNQVIIEYKENRIYIVAIKGSIEDRKHD